MYLYMYAYVRTCMHTHTQNTHSHTHACTHIQSTSKNTQTTTKGIVAAMKHIILSHSLSWGPLIYKNNAYLPPEEHALQTRGGPLRTAERQKEKQRERGWTGRQEPRHPGQRTCLSTASFFKMRQRKYWRFVDNKQLRHNSVSPA